MNEVKPKIQIKKELPKSLMVSSTLAIIFVLSLLPFIAWLLEYKDTIAAPLTITTKTTPIDVFAKTTGELILMTPNNGAVAQGKPMAIIKNSADYEDVLILKEKLNQPAKDPLLVAKDLCESKKLNVGDLKPALVEVINAIESYQTFIKTDQHNALVNSRQEQIELYRERQSLLRQKSSVLAKDKAFAEKFAEIDRKLVDKGIIAPADYDKKERDKLGTEVDSLDNETVINALDVEIRNLQQERIEIRSTYKTQDLILSQKVKDAVQILENELRAWEETYILKASIDGTCVYKDYLNDYRFVQEKELVFSLIPAEESQYFGLLKLPIAGAGKVRDSQEVYVKLNNYPFMEFGILKGQVTSISDVPFQDHYNVQVNFPNFITTYGDTLKTRPLMKGIGEVIVERKSLYNRIMDQIKSARYNR